MMIHRVLSLHSEVRTMTRRKGYWSMSQIKRSGKWQKSICWQKLLVSKFPSLKNIFLPTLKRNKNRLNALFKLFEKHDIQAAFNIGNRVNILPIQKKFVIQRIDVRGTETLNRFISKVRTGKPITGLIKDLLGKP